jgi:hypothetical protein
VPPMNHSGVPDLRTLRHDGIPQPWIFLASFASLAEIFPRLPRIDDRRQPGDQAWHQGQQEQHERLDNDEGNHATVDS